MKNSMIITGILVIGMNLSAQPQPELNQQELIRQYIGNWHYGNNPDTIMGYELHPSGDIIIQTNYNLVNNKKLISGIFSYKYDPVLKKFRMSGMTPEGNYSKYQFYFVSDKKAMYENVDDKTKKVIWKNENTIESPGVIISRTYNDDGVKTSEVKVTRTDIRSADLNQTELARQLIGVWQLEGRKDTIPGLEFQQYGICLVASDISIINENIVARNKVSFAFSKSENMFKVFFMFPNGGYSTRNAYFTSGNTFVQEIVPDFNPERLSGRSEMTFDSPTQITARIFNLSGKMTGVYKFTKAK